jgi:predicted DCC family thiol-disulfide oxidoreductase YuxK
VTGGSAPVLLYDGDCSFCGRWARRLARWDRVGRIRLLPARERNSLPGLPPLSEAALDEALHVVLPDGTVARGAGGIIALLPWLPGGRALAWLARLPGVAWLADRSYRAVARKRHRLGGADACDAR